VAQKYGDVYTVQNMFDITTNMRFCDHLATNIFYNFTPQPLATGEQICTQCLICSLPRARALITYKIY